MDADHPARGVNIPCRNTTLLSTANVPWLISSFVRQAAFDNGLVGEHAIPVDARVLTDVQIEQAKAKLKVRLQEERETILPIPNLRAFLFGWRDLYGLDDPKSWVEEIVVTDEGLLDFLDGLRSWAASTYVYYPLSKKSVSTFLEWEIVETRLAGIENSGGPQLRQRVTDIRIAISQGRDDHA